MGSQWRVARRSDVRHCRSTACRAAIEVSHFERLLASDTFKLCFDSTSSADDRSPIAAAELAHVG